MMRRDKEVSLLRVKELYLCYRLIKQTNLLIIQEQVLFTLIITILIRSMLPSIIFFS